MISNPDINVKKRSILISPFFDILNPSNIKKNWDPILRVYSSLLLQHRFNNLPQDAVHVLFWCNQGCHRSVGWCRLASIAAEVWGWTNPSCN